MNLEPKKLNEGSHRRGSFYPVESNSFKRQSIESLYSNISNKSISLLESLSSVDSVDIGKIQSINKEFEELINTRLTAFLYFYNPLPQNSQKLSITESKNSIDSPNKGGEKNSVVLSDFAKQIVTLQKIHRTKLEQLKKHKTEIETLEDEESGLSGRLVEIEEKVSKIVMEHDQKKVFCKCLIF